MVRLDILDAIVRTVSDDGRTVIFSSHLLEEVERMSDHVSMIHEGRVVVDGTLESIRQAHQRWSVRFPEPLERAPEIDGALFTEGSGRSWNVIHGGSVEEVRASAALHGGDVVQSRDATLQEIFVAHVGRGQKNAEAA